MCIFAGGDISEPVHRTTNTVFYYPAAVSQTRGGIRSSVLSALLRVTKRLQSLHVLASAWLSSPHRETTMQRRRFSKSTSLTRTGTPFTRSWRRSPIHRRTNEVSRHAARSSLRRHSDCRVLLLCVIAADGDVGASVDGCLEWLCSGPNFAAVHLLGKITASVPGVFKLIQGGPSWKARYGAMDSASATLTSATAVRELVTTVKALDGDESETRASFLKEVSGSCWLSASEVLVVPWVMAASVQWWLQWRRVLPCSR